MLPQIKKRFQTQQINQSKQKTSSILKRKVQKRVSNINTCLPYLQSLKMASFKYVPKKLHAKPQRRQRMYTDINQHAYHNIQNGQNVHQQIIGYETVPINSYKSKSLQKIQQNNGRSRVQCLLRYLQKMSTKNTYQSSNKLKNSRQLQKFIQCEQQFFKLPINKQQWNNQTIQNFTRVLSQINPFFKKLDKIVILCLLKIGFIKSYQQNEIIQKQKDPVTRIGIILWGQVLLKNSNNKLKIYLFSGDSINEQLIFSSPNQMQLQRYYCKKGCISIKQTAKTKNKTGILYLKLSQYTLIFEQLVKIGQKNSILKAQNIIKRSFAKKKNLRKQYSDI